MNLLGNIIWIICGGLISAIIWAFFGIMWCITIIGIPVGLQCFKFAYLTLVPFGKDIEYKDNISSIIINVFWLIFGGIELALTHICIGIFCCITIIGIPFGMQHFKLAKLALMPFGAKII